MFNLHLHLYSLDMKRLILILFILIPLSKSYAQDSALVRMAPGYFISTDLVYDIESIPVLGYEKLFIRNDRLESLQLDIGYQIHYNNQFGIATSHGDKIAIGVYQGPIAKFGYSLYSHRHRSKWGNYYSPSMGAKYLSYDTDTVKTGKRMSGAFRMQSEKCVDLIPQFSIGAKRTYEHFCVDFYVGLQFPLKFRDKTISLEQNAQGVENQNVPYTSNVTTLTPAPLVGIRLGYLNKKSTRT